MERKVSVGIRLASMLLDHFIMTILFTIMTGIGIGISIFIDYVWDDSWLIWVVITFFSLTAFSVYLNKDMLKGQSPAKRVLYLRVVNHTTGKTASPVSCLLRNCTLPLWPLEIPFVIIKPTRRLGDLIANTRIEPGPAEAEAIIRLRSIVLSLLLGGLYMLALLALYMLLNHKFLEMIKQFF